MAREKEGYRETLELLITVKNCPLLLSYEQTADILGVCTKTVQRMINEKKLIRKQGGIPIGSVASYICG